MKVLIDTNILIHVEDPKEMPTDLQKLFQLINSVKAEVYYHQASAQDLNSDTDTERKKIVISKLSKYKSLPTQQKFSHDQDFASKIGSSNTKNDHIDAQLLFSIYCKVVDYFITNDQRLIGRASKVGCEEKVFNVADAINIFEEFLFKGTAPKPIALAEVPMKEIDYRQKFFDSLREDYPEFNCWFDKKAKENRKAFVHSAEDGKIDAILALKPESDAIPLIDGLLPPKRRLKISPMKSTLNQTNMGELFIKLAITTAVKQDIDEIYLTHFAKKQDYLVTTIEKFGFKCVGKQQSAKGPEEVFSKPLIGNAIVPPNEDGISEFNQVYYPSFYDGKKVKKFLVPIRPEFYQKLFTESKSRQSSLIESLGGFIVEGNAIRKAYLCNAHISTIGKNDLLIFYLSGSSMATLIATVESTARTSNPGEIMKIVARRTVYTKEEISQLASKEALVILFKWNFHFPVPLSLATLKKEGVLKAPPQSIMQLDHENYIKLKTLSQLDQKYTVGSP